MFCEKSTVKTELPECDSVWCKIGNRMHIKLVVINSGIQHDTLYVLYEEPGPLPSLTVRDQDAQPYNTAVKIVVL